MWVPCLHDGIPRHLLPPAVLRKLAEDELHRALGKLTDEEYALICALFFEGKSIRAYAQELGVYPNAVHKRMKRILKKLKAFLKLGCTDLSLNGK